MNLFDNIDNIFKNILQKNVVFKIGAQYYKKGKFLLYSYGHYNIFCSIKSPTRAKIEILKLPLPFHAYLDKDFIVFDYRISSFLNTKTLIDSYKKVKKPNLSKFYDNILILEFADRE